MTHSILPTSPKFYLTDGGIETTLIFDDELDLPCFAAFTLFDSEIGRAALASYFERYIQVAKSAGYGFILESATWRASSDWGEQLGYTPAELTRANRDAIDMLKDLKTRHQSARSPMLVSGCVGPRGDGYDPGEIMTVSEAREYHSEQVGAFAKSDVDLVTGITMTNSNEAIGLCQSARAESVSCVISFTVETDGCLPTGQPLGDAIRQVDAETDQSPTYYMINCAHPTHFAGAIHSNDAWASRLGGLRANASCKSHAELDEAETLDRGDKHDLAQRYAKLTRDFPNLRVLGGCCGTDHTHIDAIAKAISQNEPLLVS